VAVTRADMTYADLLSEVRDDWAAAQESRRQLEERRLKDYRLYRRFRDDVNSYSFDEAVRGPFGWSSLTVPIIYWIVETIVPRIATVAPKIVVKPRTPEAAPFAQAKELSLNGILDEMRIEEELALALKEMVLYGDGTTKLSWNTAQGRPHFSSIPWFDYFVSSEARRLDSAEVQFHRTWYTRRQLARLSKMTDRNGKPMFHGLEEMDRTETVQAGDPTWESRREATGLGPVSWSALGGLYCLVECWYDDGTLVVLGGSRGDRIVQVRTSPYRDEKGNPVRPFVTFSNTPDTEGPYSIGDAEMLEDHQTELSTLRNQAIDQTTVNINAPLVYSGSDITGEEIDAAFGQPGGKLRVNGDVRMAVMRVAPGNVSSDFFNFYENIRAESQYVSGVNDNQAGQAGARQMTATEASTINQEANRRWQYKIQRTESSFGRVARLIDLADRRYGMPGRTIHVESDITPEPGQRGLMDMGGMDYQPGDPSKAGAFLRTHPMMNGPGTAYTCVVKGGSFTPPSEDDDIQKAIGVAQALAAIPEIAQIVKWREVAKMLARAFHLAPERIFLSEDEVMMKQLEAAMSQPAPAGNEQAGLPAGGEVPVGPPQPL